MQIYIIIRKISNLFFKFQDWPDPDPKRCLILIIYFFAVPGTCLMMLMTLTRRGTLSHHQRVRKSCRVMKVNISFINPNIPFVYKPFNCSVLLYNIGTSPWYNEFIFNFFTGSSTAPWILRFYLASGKKGWLQSALEVKIIILKLKKLIFKFKNLFIQIFSLSLWTVNYWSATTKIKNLYEWHIEKIYLGSQNLYLTLTRNTQVGPATLKSEWPEHKSTVPQQPHCTVSDQHEKNLVPATLKGSHRKTFWGRTANSSSPMQYILDHTVTVFINKNVIEFINNNTDPKYCSWFCNTV